MCDENGRSPRFPQFSGRHHEDVFNIVILTIGDPFRWEVGKSMSYPGLVNPVHRDSNPTTLT